MFSFTCYSILQAALDDESFENYKSGLIAKLLEKDHSLAYETDRFWGQITEKRWIFLPSSSCA